MICRLCLKDITEVINIFDEIGVELNVANILSKYFWFEPQKDDPISTAICNSCWIKVADFHEYYLKVEEAHRLLTERFLFKVEEHEGRHKWSSVDSGRGNPFKSDPVDAELKEVEFQYNLLEESSDDYLTATVVVKNVSETEPLQSSEERTEESSQDDVDTIFGDELSTETTTADTDCKDKLKKSISLDTLSDRRVTRSLLRDCSSQTSHIADVSNPAGDLLQPLPTSFSRKVRGRPRKATAVSSTAVSDSKRTSNNTDTKKTSNKTEAHTSLIDAKIKKFLPLTCDICAMVKPTFGDLRKHIEQIHHVKGYAVCCNKKFYKRALLSDHVEKHINPNCFRCEECDKNFADKQCMRNHFLLKHQPDEKKIHQCERCPKKFAKLYLLEQHRVVHEIKKHNCDMCQKSFATPSQLGTHVKIVHSNYGTMCDICAKVIRGKAAFDRHMLEHKGIITPKVQCDKCGSWHKNKYSLQKHKRRHNDEGTLHVCNICGKGSPNRSALLSHQRYVHAAQRAFECTVCKKSFKKAINLREHMATHTGECLYNCPHCSKTFNSNANMHSHRKKYHPKEFEEARKGRRVNLITKESQTNTEEIQSDLTERTSSDGIPIAKANALHNLAVESSSQSGSIFAVN